MREPKTLEEVYDSCSADGLFNELAEINNQKIADLVENSQINIESAETIAKAISKSSKQWMSVYIHYYEALRIYSEALIRLDKIKISNHKCLFSYLCVKHLELEFDWDFFEKTRTKRNGVNYYGEKINYKDFKDIELQIKLYISTLKKEIDKKLSLE